MPLNATSIYPILKDFILELVGDKISALRIVNVLHHADVPLQTFITTVKLYRMVLNRANRIKILEKAKTSIGTNSFDPKMRLKPEDYSILRDQYLVFITCCLIASKYYRDIAFTNESWESVSDIKIQNINETERLCLTVLDYRVNSQDDHLIHEVVTEVLKKSGMVVSDKSIGKSGRIKTLMRKILCFS